MSRRFPRPGAGFVVFTVGWILVIGFLIWGFSTPLLDRIWQINERMQRADFAGLEDSEVADLEAGIARYPELGREILGRRELRIVEPTSQRWSALGRQHLLISENWRGEQVIEVETDLSPDALPMELSLEGCGVHEVLEIEGSGLVQIPVQLLPGDGPALLRVRMDPSPGKQGRGVRFEARVPEVAP